MSLKSIKILLILILEVFQCSAQNRQVDIQETDSCVIIHVGTDTGLIKIGHQQLESKDKFNVRQLIYWTSDQHYLRVDNMRTGETYRLCAKECNEENPNILQWYIKTNYLSSKGPDNDFLNKTFYMIEDTIRIKSKLPIDHNKGYIVKSIPGNKMVTLQYDDKTNELVISKQLLEDNHIYTYPVKFHVEYQDQDSESLPLTDNMCIEYIPIIR